MKLLASFFTLAIIAMPTAALADDLVLTFRHSVSDTEYSWTVHNVETGNVPTVAFERSESEGFVISTEMEFMEDGSILLTFLFFDVTFGDQKGDFPRAVKKSRVIAGPRIQTTKDLEAYIKQGTDEDHVSMSALYVTTNGEVVEE